MGQAQTDRAQDLLRAAACYLEAAEVALVAPRSLAAVERTLARHGWEPDDDVELMRSAPVAHHYGGKPPSRWPWDNESWEVLEDPAEACDRAVILIERAKRWHGSRPVHAELTLSQAAELLNVRRAHVVKLVEDGEIAFHAVRNSRRVRLADVVAYKDQRDQRCRDELAELVALGEEFDLPY